jgi:hypothetical protein
MRAGRLPGAQRLALEVGVQHQARAGARRIDGAAGDEVRHFRAGAARLHRHEIARPMDGVGHAGSRLAQEF